MFHSAEIRWFATGSLPLQVENWFRQSDLLSIEEPRTDSYLPLEGATTTGVKLRDGRLEVKAQTSRPEPVQYANGISGYRASWVKWSSGAAGAGFARSEFAADTWVQVEKSRLLRVFALGSGEPEETPPGEHFNGPGCQLEAARLRVQGDSDNWNASREWWTMCLEAFGDRLSVLETLDRMASHPILAEVASTLPQDSSMSYPDWLAQRND